MLQRLSDVTSAELRAHQTTDLMRVLSTKAFGRTHPADYFQEHWPRSLHADIVAKHFDVPFQHAAIAVGSTTGTDWAAPLMVPSLLAGFLPLVKAASVLSKLPVTPTPFNVKLTKQLTGSSTSWVGEQSPKPISKLGFGNITMPWSKCMSIIVVTTDLLRLAAPGSEQLLQQTIKDEVTAFVDKAFLSTGAAVVGVNPAGILNGVTPITATASLAADLATLVSTFFTNRPNALAPYLILSPAVASKISAIDAGRDVTTAGGTVLGLPVVVTPAALNNAVLVDAPAVYVADGGMDLDISTDAAVQMSDAPDSPPTAATVMRSLWQNNEMGIKAERFVHWVVVGTNAVQFLPVA